MRRKTPAGQLVRASFALRRVDARRGQGTRPGVQTKRRPMPPHVAELKTLAMADFERIYRSLRRIRRAEEEVARIYPTDKIKSPVHLSIGQEAVSVGVCD